MTTRRLALLALFGSTSWAAHAADKVVYQPVPGWVKPAPAIDPAKITPDSPLLLVLDDQERLADGQVWSYKEMVTRLATSDVVRQAGTLSMAWEPAKGDLIVHQVEIIRGNQRIDALAGGKTFAVIRREERLERLEVDGELTATLAVEGLQVGDLLRVIASTTHREIALKGHLETMTTMPAQPMQAGFVRTRIIWPKDAAVRWKTYGDGVASTVGVIDGFRELVVSGPLPKPVDLPPDAPARFTMPPIIEASTFADWEAVSRTMAPLYTTDGLIVPGSELAGAVAHIATTEQDALRRASAALQLVQDKIRYLYNGMENGNYQPQTPAQTWTLRYGDCKAKSLLLLAILHQLGITAEVVLANSDMGDLVPSRLPSAATFDHVLVRATIGGETFWLDGTDSGVRYADIRDTPPLRWVLPIRSAGAALMSVPMRAPIMPMMAATIDYDQSGGLKLPTVIRAKLRMRGPFAESIGLAKTQGSKEQKEQMVAGAVGAMTGSVVAITDYTLAYDPAEGEAEINVGGLITTPWRMVDKRYRMDVDRAVSQINFDPDRARPAWKAIPVATGTPGTIAITTRVILPPDLSGFTLDGDQTLPTPLAGSMVKRSAGIVGNVVTVADIVSSSGAEIAPADIAQVRANVALAKSRLLRVIAPETPPRWAMAAAARRDGRMKPLFTAMGKAIANSPDEVEGYVNRAALYVGVYDWQGALPDLDRVIALDPNVAHLLDRADAYRMLGNMVKARADYEAALVLDPMSQKAIGALAEIDVDAGRQSDALRRIEERIAAGGEGKADMLALKADMLARSGNSAAAIATIDLAIAGKPGNPRLLNSRCWIKGTLNVALDTALKDCTRSIELSDSTVAALDSRALVFFRMNRMEDALADLGAALDIDPDQAASLYMRGVILGKQGKPEGKADLIAARTMRPRIDDDYKRYGIVP